MKPNPPGVTGGERLRAMLARVAEIHGMSVTAGIQAAEGAKAKEGPSDGTPPTLLDVATWNEFGTRRIPARSFLRATIDRRRSELTTLGRRLAKMVAVDRMTPDIMANRLGNELRASVQQQITDTTDPPNAPYTIERKGSSHPLIDTGQLRQSIRYRATIDRREVGTG